MRERNIQDDIRKAIPPSLAVLWRNNVGMREDMGPDFAIRRTRFGLFKGSSDLIGIRKRDGRFIALEVKKPGEEPTPEQEDFMRIVRGGGGIVAVVTSVQEALRAIREG